MLLIKAYFSGMFLVYSLVYLSGALINIRHKMTVTILKLNKEAHSYDM